MSNTTRYIPEQVYNALDVINSRRRAAEFQLRPGMITRVDADADLRYCVGRVHRGAGFSHASIGLWQEEDKYNGATFEEC